jgi:hypothetical protein
VNGGGGQGPGGPPPGGYGYDPRARAPQNQSPYGPYAPPQQPGTQPGMFGNDVVSAMYTPYCGTCPQCRSPHLTTPGFTWWGGLLGPKLLNHTICGSCSFGFNAKTGKSNNTAIGVYLGVGAALGILIVVMRIAAG